jgi:hypothetical protein
MSGTVPDLKGRDPSERAVRYRQKAAHFKDMASTETHPRVRAQLLGSPRSTTSLPTLVRENRASTCSLRAPGTMYRGSLFRGAT